MSTSLDLLDRYGFNYEPVNIDISELPNIFKKKYNFTFIQFEEKEEIIIMERTRDFSIEIFVKDSLLISQKLKIKTVLAFDELSEKNIKRLIHSNIAFIASNAMSLRFLGVVINDISQPKMLRGNYSYSQQQILILMLLSNKEIFNAKYIEEKTSVSIATVYRVLQYFHDLGYLESTHGSYSFKLSRTEIYEDSEKYFVMPIEKRVLISPKHLNDLKNDNLIVFASSLDALSSYTMLSSKQSDYGVIMSDLSKKHSNILEQERTLYAGLDDINLDLWKYNPTLLNNKVDPISLRLLFEEHDNDPRIEEAIINIDEYISKLLNNENERKRFSYV